MLILGAGSHAREVFATLRALGEADRVQAFVEQQPRRPDLQVEGLPVLSEAQALALEPLSGTWVGAIGSPRRRDWIEALERRGAQFRSVIHPSVIQLGKIEPAAGVYLGAGTVLTVHVRLGPHVLVNVGCSISHDCDLGAFATVSPGARLAGNVRIGEGCFIGIGATIIEAVQVGAGAVVAAGACVVRDVPPNVLVAGVPARVVRALDDGESVRFRSTVNFPSSR